MAFTWFSHDLVNAEQNLSAANQLFKNPLGVIYSFRLGWRRLGGARPSVVPRLGVLEAGRNHTRFAYSELDQEGCDMCREKHEAGMIRERYVTKLLGKSRAEIEADRLRLIKIRIREDNLAKLGGEITFDSVPHLAVDRGRK
ncbi:hypothetical protein [Ectopseudomonas hydrolytica]|uniref:hypothetical protein n=1 Tax=Ectopseudomonas hydrolytica TaxID=2493633 RepID=UPI0020B8490F|nr:hypothetical protein [Pseudomonas hydrolytica]UTH31344.1 hypothetical protein NLY38_23400 [Pseudomonas hydrolytica]